MKLFASLPLAPTASIAMAVVIAMAIPPAFTAEPDRARETKERGFAPVPADKTQWVCMGFDAGWQFDPPTIRSDSARGGNWLRSPGTFDNFVLRLEWRVSANGSGGVFIRCAERGAPWQTGYEIQLCNAPRDALHGTGSLYHSVPADPRPPDAPNVWHTLEVRCQGTRIQVIADGIKCVDFDQQSDVEFSEKPTKGFLGLQDANAPRGHFIEYRNIMVKRLPPAEPETPIVREVTSERELR